MLSLQAYDLDPYSKNYHVLTDRIGIYIYAPKSIKTADAIERMLAADIDLPMNGAKLERLAGLLNKLVKYQKQLDQMGRNSKLIADIESDEDLKCLVPVTERKNLLYQLFEMHFGG